MIRNALVATVLLVCSAPLHEAQTSRPLRAARGQAPPPVATGLDLPLDVVSFGEDPQALNRMGSAMEVLGNYLFVGAPGDGTGRVDVWYRLAGSYVLLQQLGLPSSLLATDDEFGQAIAADGGVLAVGARTAGSSGRVCVFRRRSNGTYRFDQALAPSNGFQQNGFFGERLAVLEGELVAVAARGELTVHLFEADASGRFPAVSSAVVDQVSSGTTPSASWMTRFGSTVALHRRPGGEAQVLVGMQDACFYQQTQQQAPDEVTPNASGATAARTGGVAVLRKLGTSWSIAERLIPEWSKTKDFGYEIDVDGARVGVGAIYSNVFSNGFDAGTATVFDWAGTSFELVDTVWPRLPYANAWFGASVSLCGDFLVVGQPGLWGGPQGLAEVFRITPGGLSVEDIVWAPDGNGAADAFSLGDTFGREIVCNAFGEVVIGAPFSAPSSGGGQYAGGAIYLFR